MTQPIGYEFCVNIFGTVSVHACATRQIAEACLTQFAKGAGDLDVHLHPTAYSDCAISTAFRKGGDPLFDAVAVVRPVFES